MKTEKIDNYFQDINIRYKLLECKKYADVVSFVVQGIKINTTYKTSKQLERLVDYVFKEYVPPFMQNKWYSVK